MKILKKLRQKMPVSKNKVDLLITAIEELNTSNKLLKSMIVDISVIIDGLRLNDAQHCQIETNLTKIITAKAQTKKIIPQKENKDTSRSYM